MYKFLSGLYLTFLSVILAMVSIAQAQLIVKSSSQSEILRITSTGNVGIMTTNPISRLVVSGGGSVGAGYAQIAAPVNGLIVEGNVGIGITDPGSYKLYVAHTNNRINQLNINGAYTFPVAASTASQYLNGLGLWATPPPDGDGVIGNEITAATNTTLTRSGSGTAVAPYTLGLNLANANTWTALQNSTLR